MSVVSDLTPQPDTWHVWHNTYIILLEMPGYSSLDTAYLILSNNIHKGQQVDKFAGFTCSLDSRHHERASPSHPHMFSVCCILFAGRPTDTVLRTKGMNNVQSQHITYT